MIVTIVNMASPVPRLAGKLGRACRAYNFHEVFSITEDSRQVPNLFIFQCFVFGALIALFCGFVALQAWRLAVEVDGALLSVYKMPPFGRKII